MTRRAAPQWETRLDPLSRRPNPRWWARRPRARRGVSSIPPRRVMTPDRQGWSLRALWWKARKAKMNEKQKQAEQARRAGMGALVRRSETDKKMKNAVPRAREARRAGWAAEEGWAGWVGEIGQFTLLPEAGWVREAGWASKAWETGRAKWADLSWVSNDKWNEKRKWQTRNVPKENGNNDSWEGGNQKNEKTKTTEFQPTSCHGKYQKKNQNIPASFFVQLTINLK